MKTNIGPRISDSARAFYAETFDNANAGAEYALEMIPILYRVTLARELKGRFTAGELSLILDVSNGLMLTPEIAGQQIVPSVVDSMMLDGTDKKWEVNQQSFSEKLVDLTLGQAAVLEIWAAAFWVQHDRKGAKTLEDWVGVLA
jgi:hypothetical protein